MMCINDDGVHRDSRDGKGNGDGDGNGNGDSDGNDDATMKTTVAIGQRQLDNGNWTSTMRQQ